MRHGSRATGWIFLLAGLSGCASGPRTSPTSRWMEWPKPAGVAAADAPRARPPADPFVDPAAVPWNLTRYFPGLNREPKYVPDLGVDPSWPTADAERVKTSDAPTVARRSRGGPRLRQDTAFADDAGWDASVERVEPEVARTSVDVVQAEERISTLPTAIPIEIDPRWQREGLASMGGARAVRTAAVPGAIRPSTRAMPTERRITPTVAAKVEASPLAELAMAAPAEPAHIPPDPFASLTGGVEAAAAESPPIVAAPMAAAVGAVDIAAGPVPHPGTAAVPSVMEPSAAAAVVMPASAPIAEPVTPPVAAAPPEIQEVVVSQSAPAAIVEDSNTAPAPETVELREPEIQATPAAAEVAEPITSPTTEAAVIEVTTEAASAQAELAAAPETVTPEQPATIAVNTVRLETMLEEVNAGQSTALSEPAVESTAATIPAMVGNKSVVTRSSVLVASAAVSRAQPVVISDVATGSPLLVEVTEPLAKPETPVAVAPVSAPRVEEVEEPVVVADAVSGSPLLVEVSEARPVQAEVLTTPSAALANTPTAEETVVISDVATGSPLLVEVSEAGTESESGSVVKLLPEPPALAPLGEGEPIESVVVIAQPPAAEAENTTGLLADPFANLRLPGSATTPGAGRVLSNVAEALSRSNRVEPLKYAAEPANRVDLLPEGGTIQASPSALMSRPVEVATAKKLWWSRGRSRTPLVRPWRGGATAELPAPRFPAGYYATAATADAVQARKPEIGREAAGSLPSAAVAPSRVAETALEPQPHHHNHHQHATNETAEPRPSLSSRVASMFSAKPSGRPLETASLLEESHRKMTGPAPAAAPPRPVAKATDGTWWRPRLLDRLRGVTEPKADERLSLTSDDAAEPGDLPERR